MARLIVFDASVVIAALSSTDRHHAAAAAAVTAATADDFVLSAVTRAEVLVGPTRLGGVALSATRAFVDACVTVPVTAAAADDAARLRALHPGLSLPDAFVVALGDQLDADAVWTFDRRWHSVSSRVTTP